MKSHLSLYLPKLVPNGLSKLRNYPLCTTAHPIDSEFFIKYPVDHQFRTICVDTRIYTVFLQFNSVILVTLAELNAIKEILLEHLLLQMSEAVLRKDLAKYIFMPM